MFEVFGKASIPVEPAESALDNPAFGQDDEPDAVGTFDDFKDIVEHGLGPFNDAFLVSGIDKEFEQLRQDDEQPDEHEMTAARVRYAAGVNSHREQVALCIYRDVPLAALDLLAAVIAALPPFCTVLTLWLSIIATVGSGFLPIFSRTLRRR